MFVLCLKVRDSGSASRVWKIISLLARLREDCVRQERDGVGQQQWIIYDSTDWPHAASVLLLLFYPNSSYRKQLLCLCFFVQKHFDYSWISFQADKQTIKWEEEFMKCVRFTFSYCFLCSRHDIQWSKMFLFLFLFFSDTFSSCTFGVLLF